MTASMPAFEDLAAYEQAIHEQAPWMGALAHIGTQTALDVISELSVMTCCRSPVLGSRDHVVKLYPRAWLPTRSKYLDEVAAYEVLARDPDLPVPRLLAHGAIDGGADYIVLSRIHGRQLTAIMADLAAAELEGIAAWSGRYLRRLHALRLTPDERDRGHAALVARVDRSTVLERLASLRAMPDRLLAEVEGWLPAVADLVGDARAAGFLHYGFKPKHVIVERQHGHWVGNGVVDFNRLTIGPPLADLPRFWHVVRAWPSASIETFMAASGLRDRAASVTSLAREALAWALVQRQHRAWSIDGLEDVRSLDELAELAFARVIEGR